MSDLLTDLKNANIRGVAPPQNWTHGVIEEIARLNARIKDYQDACAQKQEIINGMAGDLKENEEVLKAVESALDDVPYKGSYADGIEFLKARIKELEELTTDRIEGAFHQVSSDIMGDKND